MWWVFLLIFNLEAANLADPTGEVEKAVVIPATCRVQDADLKNLIGRVLSIVREKNPQVMADLDPQKLLLPFPPMPSREQLPKVLKEIDQFIEKMEDEGRPLAREDLVKLNDFISFLFAKSVFTNRWVEDRAQVKNLPSPGPKASEKEKRKYRRNQENIALYNENFIPWKTVLMMKELRQKLKNKLGVRAEKVFVFADGNPEQNSGSKVNQGGKDIRAFENASKRRAKKLKGNHQVLMNERELYPHLIWETRDTNIEALHLYGHGGEGGMVIHGKSIQASNLRQLSSDFAKDSVVFLHGCETGQGEQGKTYYENLGSVLEQGGTVVGFTTKSWQNELLPGFRDHRSLQPFKSMRKAIFGPEGKPLSNKIY